MNGRSSRWARSVGLALLGLVSLGLAGCYERTANGGGSIYHFAWWMGPLVIVGALAAMTVGWLLRRKSARYGWGLMIVGPLLMVLVAPAMYNDRVIIDDQHFEARYGLWFSPNEQSVRFADLLSIHYVAVPGNRGRKNYQLHCQGKDGNLVVVPAGDLVKQTVTEILSRAGQSGVDCQDLTERQGVLRVR